MVPVPFRLEEANVPELKFFFPVGYRYPMGLKGITCERRIRKFGIPNFNSVNFCTTGTHLPIYSFVIGTAVIKTHHANSFVLGPAVINTHTLYCSCHHAFVSPCLCVSVWRVTFMPSPVQQHARACGEPTRRPVPCVPQTARKLSPFLSCPFLSLSLSLFLSISEI
jgi:hypothetical protein